MLDYIVDAAVVYIPIKRYKAVSESGHICEAFGKRSVYEVCLSQIPETVAKIFGNSFQFRGRNIKADVQGSFIADFTPNTEEALKRYSDTGMHLVQSTDNF